MLTHVVDRTGYCWAELTWRDRTFERFRSEGLLVHGEVFDHPLLGNCHHAGQTAMTALDWTRPTEIPTIESPRMLPASSGGVLLNTIATLAQQAGVATLRYAGPYPTPALWRSLARSFRCTSSEAEFTATALDRMARVARDELPIDFVPAPHERVLLRLPTGVRLGHVEIRDGLDRVVISSVAYDRDGSPARLVDDRAEVWFGDRVYAHVATIGLDGSLVAGPHPIPACTSNVVGRTFPPDLSAAIAELVVDIVPAPLASDVRRAITAKPMRWADLQAVAARETSFFEIHAAIWENIAPLGLARVALAIAEAVAPVVVQSVLTAVTRTA